LRPGRASDATSPLVTGSEVVVNTTGSLSVTLIAASAILALVAKIRSGPRSAATDTSCSR